MKSRAKSNAAKPNSVATDLRKCKKKPRFMWGFFLCIVIRGIGNDRRFYFQEAIFLQTSLAAAVTSASPGTILFFIRKFPSQITEWMTSVPAA